jgi:hypothetical protein
LFFKKTKIINLYFQDGDENKEEAAPEREEVAEEATKEEEEVQELALTHDAYGGGEILLAEDETAEDMEVLQAIIQSNAQAKWEELQAEVCIIAHCRCTASSMYFTHCSIVDLIHTWLHTYVALVVLMLMYIRGRSAHGTCQVGRAAGDADREEG